MNFLAHAVLAGSNRSIVAGSLAGDFVKGVVRDGDFPAEYLVGIRLHRRIDAFSNAEEHLRASAARMPGDLRRIAPPCIDLLADHFLARAIAADAGAYLPQLQATSSPASSLPYSALQHSALQHYEEALHQLLIEHDSWLSLSAKRFFDHASTTQLFSDYQTFERVSGGVNYVCERLRRAEAGPAMVAAMATHIDALHEDFANYWPALVDEANRFLQQHFSPAIKISVSD